MTSTYAAVLPQLKKAHNDQLAFKLRRQLKPDDQMSALDIALVLQRAVRYSMASDFVVKVLDICLRNKCMLAGMDVQPVLDQAQSVIESEEEQATKKTKRFVEKNVTND